jgi:predicted nuclease of restriction endonuclease-like RecB superfamily
LKKKAQKCEETCLEKYGVSNAGQVPEIKKKINDTYIEKFGMHPKKTAEVHNKWVATCLERYGGHPNQNAEVQAKSEKTSFAYKDYMMPSGNIVKYQGYENLALDELVKLYDEEDIKIGRSVVPTIIYHIDNVKHVYFPDFYIKSENKIIEVKSEWTLQLYRAHVEEKAKATIHSGYKFEIWVYDRNKKKLDTIFF